MKTRTNILKLASVLGMSAALVLSACGKKSDDEAATTTTTTGTNPENVTAANPLAGAYPSSLNLSAFPTTSSASLTGDDEYEWSLADVTDQNAAAKKEAAAKILKGDGECLPDAVKQEVKASEETCYEFDQEQIYGSTDGGTTYKGTKDGKNSKGEACLVAFGRSKIKSLVFPVDRALAFTQMGLCFAKKKGLAKVLEAVNDSVDMAAAMSDGAGDKVSKVSTAKVTRMADVTDGDKTYKKFKIEIVMTRPDGAETSIKLTHVRKDDDNINYYGVFQLSETLNTNEKKEVGLTEASTKKRIMTISYGRKKEDDGTGKIAYQMRTAMFDSTLESKAIGDDGMLDYNAGASFTGSSTDQNYGSYTGFNQANDAVSGISYIAFTGNEETNEGDMVYAQNPGGNYGENARGMQVSLTKNSAGLLEGCAYSGATGYNANSGFSIRKAIKESKDIVFKGFYHPFFSGGTQSSDSVGTFYTKAQGNMNAKWYLPESTTNGTKFVTDQMGNLISKQCFKQDATSKAYNIDTTQTTTAKGYDFVETKADVNPKDPPKGDLVPKKL